MAQIEAYVTEISVKIILGIESAAIYDEYIINLEQLGLNEVLTIQQNALERYYAR